MMPVLIALVFFGWLLLTIVFVLSIGKIGPLVAIPIAVACSIPIGAMARSGSGCATIGRT
jgi:hypothetical protein